MLDPSMSRSKKVDNAQLVVLMVLPKHDSHAPENVLAAHQL
jgi:hypothetical protein